MGLFISLGPQISKLVLQVKLICLLSLNSLILFAIIFIKYVHGVRIVLDLKVVTAAFVLVVLVWRLLDILRGVSAGYSLRDHSVRVLIHV